MSGSVRPKTCSPSFLRHEINAGGDVAPLVAAADLQFAIVLLAQMIKIKRLQQHVAELGVADAGLAVFHARADAFLGDHHVDGKMFADVAQKIEELTCAVQEALSTSRAGLVLASKSSNLRELHFHAGDVGVQNFLA